VKGEGRNAGVENEATVVSAIADAKRKHDAMAHNTTLRV
jgi:hypothetical protein